MFDMSIVQCFYTCSTRLNVWFDIFSVRNRVSLSNMIVMEPRLLSENKYQTEFLDAAYTVVIPRKVNQLLICTLYLVVSSQRLWTLKHHSTPIALPVMPGKPPNYVFLYYDDGIDWYCQYVPIDGDSSHIWVMYSEHQVLDAHWVGLMRKVARRRM